MYFLTKRDPDYAIKGSRDPLGFQVLWQEAGRRIIPNLSTVSSTIRDFQILCIAYALKSELDIKDNEFEFFFICVEQVMGYTRYLCRDDGNFNGVDRVRKRADGSYFSISILPNDQLMSSQKSYGIWGKYIRPFIDSQLTEHPNFNLYRQKIGTNKAFLELAGRINRGGPERSFRISRNDLYEYSSLLEKPEGIEKELLSTHLLRDKYNGEFLRIVQQKNGFTEGISLYALLDTMETETQSETFKGALKYIRNTEKVLCPLNRIFRYLQTQSYWSIGEIANSGIIKNWRTAPDTAILEGNCKDLAGLLALSNVELVRGLVARNKEVAERRNSESWMRWTDRGLEVNHEEGVFFDEGYDPSTDSDFSYFLYTFLYLYRQLN